MSLEKSRAVLAIAGGICAILLATLISHLAKNTPGEATRKKQDRLIPIEVAEVRRGPLFKHRTFSGTIDPSAQFAVAPKVSGSVRRVHVDTADRVFRGQIVVEMEAAEFEQEVIEAEARVAVAEANRVEAVSRLDIAQRELARAKALSDRGIASESSYDTTQAQFLTSQAAVTVAAANLKREEAFLRAARIRLGYTQVRAEWDQGDNQRIVAERFVNEGNTVAANTPILSIVEIDPVIAVIQVTEKDYPLIGLGQQATVRADAFPDKNFIGTVSRISPIFRESSRQAEMELTVENREQLLKPGMFAQCTIELFRAESALTVPETAITKRNDQSGIFTVNEDEATVKWVKVEQGVTTGGRVQLLGTELSGPVVTLGQQFIKDGSKVRIVSRSTTPPGGMQQ